MSFWGRLKGYLASSPYRIHGRGSVKASHYSAKEESLNLKEARNKSRDLIRNSAVMATLHKTIIGGVLGSGLKFKSDVDFMGLGIDQGAGEKLNNAIEKAYSVFVKSCGVNGESIEELTEVAFSSYLADGEFFFHFPVVSKELKIQIIESSEVRKVHYKKELVRGYELMSNKRMGRYKDGVEQFHHYFRRFRANQVRGLPPFIASFKIIESLSAYINNEVEASRITSMLSFIFKEGPNYQGGSMLPKLEAGQSISLPRDMDVTTLKSERPNVNFDKFVDFCLDLIATNASLPPEFLKKVFLKNYSASRMSKEMAEEAFSHYRKHFVDKFLRVVYERVLEHLVMSGRLDLPHFKERRYEYVRPRYVASLMRHIDPQKEVKAKVMALEHNLTTLKIELAKEGLDFEEVLKQRKIEKDLITSYGLRGDEVPWQDEGDDEEQEEEEEEIEDEKKGNETIKGAYGVML